MKNPRGHMLSAMFIAAMLLFAAGCFQINSNNAVRHDLNYSMNAPPGQIVIAVIENPTFPVIQMPAAEIQIARGTSVPDKGLTYSAADLFYDYQNLQSIGIVSTLGDRYTFATNLNINEGTYLLLAKSKDQPRGANTRLDIGENLMVS